MSLALFITPEHEVKGLNCNVDGKAIGHISDASLDRWARELDIPCLLDLVSQPASEVADFIPEFDEEWDDFDWGDNPQGAKSLAVEQWFPASLGLAAVRPLLQYLREQAKQTPNIAAVLQDLDDFVQVLEQLEAHEIRFHFSIYF